MRGRKNQGIEITDTHPNVENSVPDKAFLSKIYGIYNIYICFGVYLKTSYSIASTNQELY